MQQEHSYLLQKICRIGTYINFFGSWVCCYIISQNKTMWIYTISNLWPPSTNLWIEATRLQNRCFCKLRALRFAEKSDLKKNGVKFPPNKVFSTQAQIMDLSQSWRWLHCRMGAMLNLVLAATLGPVAEAWQPNSCIMVMVNTRLVNCTSLGMAGENTWFPSKLTEAENAWRMYQVW